MATFINARHNDYVASAPSAWFQGGPKPAPAVTSRPMTSPAVGLRHEPGTQAYSFTDGTPNFVPPNARNNGYRAIGERQEPATPAWNWAKGPFSLFTPPPRNLGYVAIGVQQPDGNNTAPFSYTLPLAPQIQLAPHSRGSKAFATSGSEYDWSQPFIFARAVVGIPTPAVLGTPAYRATFVKARGHWDLAADAAFFFAAGFATSPPGPPPMRAKGELHLSGDAAYAYTFSWRPPFVGTTAPGRAFGLQLPGDVAPFSLALPTRLQNQAGPPITARAFGLQLPGDTAPYSFAVGRAKITNVPPIPGGYGRPQPPDFAPWVWVRSTSPVVLTFVPSFRTFGLQQPADRAPFSHVNLFVPGIHGPVTPSPTITDFAFGLQQPGDFAAFTWTSGLPLGSTIPPVTAEILSAAIFRIVNANLLVAIPLLFQHSNTIPPGYVIDTIPPTGSVLPIWSPVQIIVSIGPAYPFGKVSVPYVVGMTAQAARDALFAAGLSLDRYSWQIDSATAGTVIAQSPAASSPPVFPGTLVRLTLSMGPTKSVQTVTIPPPNSS